MSATFIMLFSQEANMCGNSKFALRISIPHLCSNLAKGWFLCLHSNLLVIKNVLTSETHQWYQWEHQPSLCSVPFPMVHVSKGKNSEDDDFGFFVQASSSWLSISSLIPVVAFRILMISYHPSWRINFVSSLPFHTWVILQNYRGITSR